MGLCNRCGAPTQPGACPRCGAAAGIHPQG